jgi:dTDP-4-amino-4,6-dideoxygalactose transaminase
MLNSKDGNLAINGGMPVTKEPVLIHKPFLDENDFLAVNDAMRSTFISGNGPSCMEFEKRLADYFGVKYVLFTNSCTTALDLAFRVKNFPVNSEVIVPNFTYTSTALGPLLNALKVVLVDVNPLNGNVDIDKIEELITDKTVAIVPVDYAGNPVEMDKIIKIAKKHSLFVVHDTAQSIGSIYNGKQSGTLADISTFSFHGTKNLTTGEGGAIITNNDEMYNRLLFMREKGTDKQSFLVDNKTRGFYEYVDIGSSYVQSNVLGALGISQLSKIHWMNEERKKIAKFYINELSGIQGLDFLKITENCDPNWHLFGILVPPENRYWVMDALRSEGIMANVHYTPLHLNKFYFGLSSNDLMKNSIEFFNRLLRLPIYPSLSQQEREWVVEAVKKVFGAK